MYNMHKNKMYSLCIVPVDIHSNLMYNIDVRRAEAITKGGLPMKFKEFQKLSREAQEAYWKAYQKAFLEKKKRPATVNS